MLEQAYWEQSKYGMVVLLGHFVIKQTENRAYKSFVLQNSSLDQERTALISFWATSSQIWITKTWISQNRLLDDAKL